MTEAQTARPAAPTPPRRIPDEELVRRLSYHKPDERRAQLHQEVDRIILRTARELVALTPPGREQALTITALEDVRMRANQAIAMERP